MQVVRSASERQVRLFDVSENLLRKSRPKVAHGRIESMLIPVGKLVRGYDGKLAVILSVQSFDGKRRKRAPEADELIHLRRVALLLERGKPEVDSQWRLMRLSLPNGVLKRSPDGRIIAVVQEENDGHLLVEAEPPLSVNVESLLDAAVFANAATIRELPKTEFVCGACNGLVSEDASRCPRCGTDFDLSIPIHGPVALESRERGRAENNSDLLAVRGSVYAPGSSRRQRHRERSHFRASCPICRGPLAQTGRRVFGKTSITRGGPIRDLGGVSVQRKFGVVQSELDVSRKSAVEGLEGKTDEDLSFEVKLQDVRRFSSRVDAALKGRSLKVSDIAWPKRTSSKPDISSALVSEPNESG